MHTVTLTCGWLIKLFARYSLVSLIPIQFQLNLPVVFLHIVNIIMNAIANEMVIKIYFLSDY